MPPYDSHGLGNQKPEEQSRCMPVISALGVAQYLVCCDFCDPHAQPDIHTRLPEGFQGAILQVACEGGQDGLPALQQRHLHGDSATHPSLVWQDAASGLTQQPSHRQLAHTQGQRQGCLMGCMRWWGRRIP